jgi:hypothetical protein
MEKKLKDEQHVQAKGGSGGGASAGLEGALAKTGGTGRPLPSSTRLAFESGFGADFRDIRIHTGPTSANLSRSISAEAFTYGNDVYFGAGKYDDSSKGGKLLIAHELTHTLQQGGVRRKAIQRRGGPTVGEVRVNTNVVGEGLTAGHAWLSYVPAGGAMTTYGTWGTRTPIGLHRDIERGYSPKATRSASVDSGDYSSLTSYAAANDTWGYIYNCAWFAARGWRAVTGEGLDYSTIGIPNPSALGEGIVAANGGLAGTLTPAAPGAGPATSDKSSVKSSW